MAWGVGKIGMASQRGGRDGGLFPADATSNAPRYAEFPQIDMAKKDSGEEDKVTTASEALDCLALLYGLQLSPRTAVVVRRYR